MMQFKIMSRSQADLFYNNNPYAFISISDATAVREPFLEIRDKSLMGNCLAVLPLFFWDIDPIQRGKYFGETFYYVNGKPVRDSQSGLFTGEQAEEILEFFNEYRHCVDFFAIHCNAGISRSSGVAAALQVVADGRGSDQWIFQDGRYMPNRWVYRKILDKAFGSYKDDPRCLS